MARAELANGTDPKVRAMAEEEGVVIDDFLLVEQGRFREAEFRALVERPGLRARPGAPVSTPMTWSTGVFGGSLLSVNPFAHVRYGVKTTFLQSSSALSNVA